MNKNATELTDAARAEIARRNFALTSNQSSTGKPAYPIQDRAHARAALGMVGMHGTAAQKSEVRKDVANRYPDLIKKAAPMPMLPGPGSVAQPGVLGRVRSALSGEAGHHAIELGGLGMLAVPGLDHLQAQGRAMIAGDNTPEGVEHRRLLGEGAHAALDVGGLGVLAAPEVHKLMAIKHAFVDEMMKIGAVSDEEARRAADRLETLERQALTPQQVARNVAFGAATGPALSALSNVVRGGPHAPMTARGFAADAVKGGVAGGLIPLAQRAMDRRGEEATLRSYLNEPREFANDADKMAAAPTAEEQQDNPYVTAGTIGGGLAARSAGDAISKNMGTRMMDFVKKDMNPELLEKVRGQAGIPVTDSPGFSNAAYIGQNQSRIFNWLKKKAPGGGFGPAQPIIDNLQEGPHIQMGPDFNSPSVLSHEIGHHQFEQSLPGKILQHPASAIMQKMHGNIGAASGGLTAALSDDPRVHAAGMLLPAALAGGMLVSEGAASLHGLRNLQRAGATAAQMQNARKALGTAFGTYGGAAVKGMGSALLAHGVGRGIRSYSRSEDGGMQDA